MAQTEGEFFPLIALGKMLERMREAAPHDVDAGVVLPAFLLWLDPLYDAGSIRAPSSGQGGDG